MTVNTCIHSIYMEMALDESRKAVRNNEVPVGCVVVHNGVVVARTHNRTNCENDPLAHAEIIALRSIEKSIYSSKLVFYITIEPCVMCHGILRRADVSVYFGAYNPIFGTKKILNEEAGFYLQNEKCVAILKEFYLRENVLAPESKRIKKENRRIERKI